MKWDSFKDAKKIKRAYRDSMVAELIRINSNEPRFIGTGDTLILWWPWPDDNREAAIFDLKVRRESNVKKSKKQRPAK